jgi:3'(2'), 5'-bisphosphate nucleotidase
MSSPRIDIEFLYTLSQIAQEAGEIIMEFYKKDLDVVSKSDSSPVTEADFKASEHIVKRLKEAYPNTPSLSEESPKEVFDQRKEWKNFFLIDPLDGTKEFIKKSHEFTVNIAYIENHRVLAGVVDCPALNETYYGMASESYVSRQGMEFRLPLDPYKDGLLRVVSSKSHKNEETEAYIEDLKKKYKKVEAKTFGSSLKICKVAEGVADLNPRLGQGTKEWDIAAAHAVLMGTGGQVVELGTRKIVTYNKDTLLNPEYEAKRKELYHSMELFK